MSCVRFLLASLLAGAAVAGAAQKLPDRHLIKASARFGRATYSIPAPGDENGAGALIIRGDNLTVDFGGSTLAGSPDGAEPDQRRGVGVQVEGKNITIRNLTVRGYKVGLIARRSPGLKLLHCDFSYNWKQHLLSTPDREDESDWLSYHQNEKDEWLRYGAGIYLRQCDDFEVNDCTVRGGQDGLMLTQCNRGKVSSCDFSFNSGIGLGLYRSSDNRILQNAIDYDVRGYSDGVYNRGQDSAGILIYEQSHRNRFLFNSVTHGGDGFFLWAGQSTMDTGKGGCNDNLVYGNDFSYAVTNGIEATFSRNTFASNLMIGCWHGVWAGYSFDSKFADNILRDNEVGIAWEHGQNNSIEGGSISGGEIAIDIWADPVADPSWGYARNRDVASHGWTFRKVLLEGNSKAALRLSNSKNISMDGLMIVRPPKLIADGPPADQIQSHNNVLTYSKAPSDLEKYRSLFERIDSKNVDEPMSLDRLRRVWLAQLSSRNASSTGSKMGTPWLVGNEYQTANRSMILVDEWGPYDFRSPRLFRIGTTTRNIEGMDGVIRTSFRVMGPTGHYTVKKVEGGTIDGGTGVVPGTFDILQTAGKTGKLEIELEYVGGKTTDYRGIVTEAGRPVRFGYRNTFVPIDWKIDFYAWAKSQNAADPNAPPDETAFKEIIAGRPIKTVRLDSLNFASNSPFVPGVPSDHFLTVANGTFETDRGKVLLELVTDDGARVWVDGQEVIAEAWKYQGPTEYRTTLDLQRGKHAIRVEHFEISGYSALRVKLTPLAGSSK